MPRPGVTCTGNLLRPFSVSAAELYRPAKTRKTQPRKIRDKLDQYDATRPFSSWLYKVAANHCWDMLRRRKIRQDKETDDSEALPLEHPDPNQLEQLIEKRTSEEVRKALDKLGSRARMALVLRYYSDMSYDEIADSLGVRRAFVGVVLLRARHELRQALEGTGAMAAGGAR